jgi:hypothetical protein
MHAGVCDWHWHLTLDDILIRLWDAKLYLAGLNCSSTSTGRNEDRLLELSGSVGPQVAKLKPGSTFQVLSCRFR